MQLSAKEKDDLKFLLGALRVEAHGLKKRAPQYAAVLLRRLDEYKLDQ